MKLFHIYAFSYIYSYTTVFLYILTQETVFVSLFAKQKICQKQVLKMTKAVIFPSLPPSENAERQNINGKKDNKVIVASLLLTPCQAYSEKHRCPQISKNIPLQHQQSFTGKTQHHLNLVNV